MWPPVRELPRCRGIIDSKLRSESQCGNPGPHEKKKRFLAPKIAGRAELAASHPGCCFGRTRGLAVAPVPLPHLLPNKGGNDAAASDLLGRWARSALRHVHADTCLGALLPSPLLPSPLLPSPPSSLLVASWLSSLSLVLASADCNFPQRRGRSRLRPFRFSDQPTSLALSWRASTLSLRLKPHPPASLRNSSSEPLDQLLLNDLNTFVVTCRGFGIP
jgi:hypothetical protein